MGNLYKVFDKLTIEIGKAYETIEVAKVVRVWPICDGLYFYRIHRYFAFTNDKAEVFDLRLFEFAFFGA